MKPGHLYQKLLVKHVDIIEALLLALEDQHSQAAQPLTPKGAAKRPVFAFCPHEFQQKTADPRHCQRARGERAAKRQRGGFAPDIISFARQRIMHPPACARLTARRNQTGHGQGSSGGANLTGPMRAITWRSTRRRKSAGRVKKRLCRGYKTRKNDNRHEPLSQSVTCAYR